MAIAGYNFDPTQLNEKDLNDYIQYYQTQRTRGLGAQGQTTGQIGLHAGQEDSLQRLLQEQQKRQGLAQQRTQQGQIEDYYSQIPGQDKGFDMAGYQNALEGSAAGQRQGLSDTYNNELSSALQGINQNYIGQKQGLAEDLAAQGLLNQGNSRYSLNALDAARGQDVANTYSRLGSARGQALTGLEQGLASQLGQGRQFAASLGQNDLQNMRSLGLAKAQGLSSALTGGNQFNQTFGLAQNQFNAGQGENAFNNQTGIYGLAQADRLGSLQAQAQKRTGLQDFGDIAGGVGSLLGGVGGLRRGLK